MLPNALTEGSPSSPLPSPTNPADGDEQVRLPGSHVPAAATALPAREPAATSAADEYPTSHESAPAA
jgi:hypothetical protein